MNKSFADLFMIEVMITSALSMLGFFGGFLVCWMHRQLSSWLLLVAVAFAGLFVATGLPLVATQAAQDVSYWPTLLLMGSSLLYVISFLLLVFGLGLALIEIRRKLSIAMEPKHGRS